MTQNRYKRPLASMMAALQSGVVTERHHFKTVDTNIPLPKRAKLEASYFQSVEENESLPFKMLANNEAKAGHYSPKAENNNVHGWLNGEHIKPVIFRVIRLMIGQAWGSCSDGRYSSMSRLHEISTHGRLRQGALGCHVRR